MLMSAASLAVALPMLMAFNVPPSATFLNQAAAIIGWAVFLLLLARSDAVLHIRRGLSALLLALLICALAALGTTWFAALPAPLSRSSLGLISAAALTALVAAAAARAGDGAPAFRAFCAALVLAGLFSVAVGWIQVFAPDRADGVWIAASAFEGRASGNLRQPNHVSTLFLWAGIAAVWLAQARVMRFRWAGLLMGAFVLGLVLSASRTGVVGVVMLALWGALDRRLPQPMRLLLVGTPVIYGLLWLGVAAWAHHTQQVFGGAVRLTGNGDISSSRFGIWSDTVALIARSPLLGVGFGEFNFAWSLTPFPHRPVAFFDHTHNLVLQLVVELGLPLAALVLYLLAYALWRAFVLARAADEKAQGAMGTAAFMVVLIVVAHSQLEYPLWYAYFLLPASFALGLCLGGEPVGLRASSLSGPRSGAPSRSRLPVLGALLMFGGGVVSLVDYSRVASVFSDDEASPSLAERIAVGQRSWFFAHHAHYAAATTAEQPSSVMPSIRAATHYLLDTRLMIAWAKALNEAGDVERARHIAQRLREFRNEDAQPFFAPCDEPAQPGVEKPFQCTLPTKQFDFRDFR